MSVVCVRVCMECGVYVLVVFVYGCVWSGVCALYECVWCMCVSVCVWVCVSMRAWSVCCVCIGVYM